MEIESEPVSTAIIGSPLKDRLKLLGQADWKTWPDYSSVGATTKDVPELISILEKDSEYWKHEETMWLPVHAWRTIGHLKAVESADALVEHLLNADDDDDWTLDEIPKILIQLGDGAIPALKEALNGSYRPDDLWPYAGLIGALGQIAQRTKSEEALSILRDMMQTFELRSPSINGFLTSELTDLGDIESLDHIEEAFAQDFIDTDQIDWDYVKMKFKENGHIIPPTPKSLKPKPKPTDFSYAGDETFEKLLNTLGSYLSVEEVKLLLLGAILAVETVPPSSLLEVVEKDFDEKDLEFETQGQAMKFIREFMGLYNLMSDYQEKLFPLQKMTFEAVENTEESTVELFVGVFHRRRELSAFLQGFEMGGPIELNSPVDEARGFLSSIRKFVGWLEALCAIEDNKGLNKVDVTSILRQIDEYWEKNYLNFARQQRGARLRKMEKIEFVENHKHVGRNEPCPCGSGKKFKKCCLQ